MKLSISRTVKTGVQNSYWYTSGSPRLVTGTGGCGNT